MPQTNVSSCVLSIIASFSSGLDVFRKIRDARDARKRKIRKNVKALTDEEIKLARSLRQGPEDIGREYQRSIQILGDEFAIGDAIAQNSLAEVLLRLNTGLVNIINTFLSREAKDAQLDCRSLIILSEKSRDDTCRTLRQLYKRMVHLRPPPVQPISEQSASEASKSRTSVPDSGKRKKTNAATKHAKVRAPMIARVVVENSARPSQIALVKPGERRKKSSRPSATPKLSSASLPALAKPASTQQLTASVERQPPRPANVTSRGLPGELQHGGMNHAHLDVMAGAGPPRPAFQRAAHSTSDLDRVFAPEQVPAPAAPLGVATARIEPRRRKPTPTYYSIASGSTRLGEIPLHKWSEPYDFDAMSVLNREAARNGWPVENPHRAPQVIKKKRFGIFKLFRKNDVNA